MFVINKFCFYCILLASELVLIIKMLKYLNFEVDTSKIINSRKHIDIGCRINPSQEHIWHTIHSQPNIVVDLIYTFFIYCGKDKIN